MALDAAAAPGIAACAIPRQLANTLAVYVRLRRAGALLSDPVNPLCFSVQDGRPGCEDLLLQAIVAVLRLLHHPETRDAFIDDTEVPGRAASLIGHSVSQACSGVLGSADFSRCS